jgi:hypothetical protein
VEFGVKYNGATTGQKGGNNVQHMRDARPVCHQAVQSDDGRKCWKNRQQDKERRACRDLGDVVPFESSVDR